MAIRDVDALREIYRPPGAPAIKKQIAALDEHCRAFIAHSPLVMLASTAADGSCDVSPKGGPPGFVAVLDDNRLALGDLSGNNRLDSMQNVLSGGGVGLLFLIPGLDETLRVNGRAHVTDDPAVLDACVIGDTRPRAAIEVEVDEAYIHCAKAFRRAGAWTPEAWPDRSDMPSVGCMLRDHVGLNDMTGEAVTEVLERDYTRSLWEPGG
jgi:PPOX class probable FMN-dependent enzyme